MQDTKTNNLIDRLHALQKISVKLTVVTTAKADGDLCRVLLKKSLLPGQGVQYRDTTPDPADCKGMGVVFAGVCPPNAAEYVSGASFVAFIGVVPPVANVHQSNLCVLTGPSCCASRLLYDACTAAGIHFPKTYRDFVSAIEMHELGPPADCSATTRLHYRWLYQGLTSHEDEKNGKLEHVVDLSIPELHALGRVRATLPFTLFGQKNTE